MCNSKIQLPGDSVVPRIQQKLRTNNFHCNFSRLRRWDSLLTETKQRVVDSQRMAAALQRTTQKCTSERVDQGISVQFRIMTLGNFDVLLTVHFSITLVNDQLDVQIFYFIIRLLQSSTCFEQRRAHH